MKNHKYHPDLIRAIIADPEYILIFFKKIAVERNDILFLPKQRTNGDYTMKCFFHDERTPSMRLNRRTGIVKCFGCGRAANIFKFLQEEYRISFFEAIGKALQIKKNPEGLPLETDSRQLRLPFFEYGWYEFQI
jgi:hypothetical protein